MHETKKLTSIEHFSFSRYAGLVIGRLFSKRFRCYKRFDQLRFDCIYFVHSGFDLCIQDLWRDRIENSSDSLRPEFSECDVTDLMRFFWNSNLFFFGQIRIRFKMLSPCRGGFRVVCDLQVFFIILSKHGVLLQLIVLRDLLFCYFIISSLT